MSWLFGLTDHLQHVLWLCQFAERAGSEGIPLSDGAALGGGGPPSTRDHPGKSGQNRNQESICPFSSQVFSCKMGMYFPALTLRGMRFAIAHVLGTV